MPGYKGSRLGTRPFPPLPTRSLMRPRLTARAISSFPSLPCRHALRGRPMSPYCNMDRLENTRWQVCHGDESNGGQPPDAPRSSWLLRISKRNPRWGQGSRWKSLTYGRACAACASALPFWHEGGPFVLHAHIPESKFWEEALLPCQMFRIRYLIRGVRNGAMGASG